MGTYVINSFHETLKDAVETYEDYVRRYPNEAFEVWEIKPNKFGMRFLVLTRRHTMERDMKVAFKRLVRRKESF